MTIASLVVSLVAQHEAFTSGMKAAGEGVEGFTRNHLSLSRTMEAVTTPAERAQKQFEQLTKWHEIGKINAEQYSRALEKVNEQLSVSSRSGEGGMFAGFSEGARHILEVTGAVELARKGLEELKQAFEDVGDMSRSALRLGVGIEDMSRLTHAAHEAHTDIGSLEMGFNRLNKAIGEVVNGEGKEAAAAFQRLHLNIQRLATESPIQAFEDVAAALDKEASASQRAADVAAIFGRGGMSLIPILHDLKESMEEADKIGFTRTREEAERVEQSERRMVLLTDTIKAKFMDIASSGIVNEALGLPVEKAEAKLTDFIKLLGGPGSQLIANDIAGMPDDLKTQGFMTLMGGPVTQALSLFLEKPAEAAAAKLHEVHDAATDAANGITKFTDAAKDTFDPIQKQIDQMQKLKDKYEDAANVFGMSPEGADIFHLQQMKNPFMTPDFGTNLQAQIQFKQFEDMRNAAIKDAEFVDALKQEADAHQKAGHAAREHSAGLTHLFDDITHLIGASDNPLQKYEKEAQKIFDMVGAGYLDPEDAAAALSGARKGLAHTVGDDKKGGGNFKDIDPRFIDIRGLMGDGGKQSEEAWREQALEQLRRIAQNTNTPMLGP